jgi:hypothetical protein
VTCSPPWNSIVRWTRRTFAGLAGAVWGGAVGETGWAGSALDAAGVTALASAVGAGTTGSGGTAGGGALETIYHQWHG